MEEFMYKKKYYPITDDFGNTVYFDSDGFMYNPQPKPEDIFEDMFYSLMEDNKYDRRK